MPWILRRESSALARRQCEIAGRADVVTLVSTVEAQILAEETGRAVRATPMAVHGPDSPTPTTGRPRELVFLGGMDYGPNLTCILDFDRLIRPSLVRHGLPDVQLHVIGHAAEAATLVSAAVVFQGYCEDLDVAMQDYRAMLVPEVSIGGIKTKIIVAALNGTVVLAHQTATEGLGLEVGRNVLVWENVQELAVLLRQMRDGTLDLEHIALEARSWARDRFSPSTLREMWRENVMLAVLRTNVAQEKWK